MNYKKDNILEYFIQQLQKQLGKHLKQIILFGSRARGDNAPDSDYDCLLILDETSRLINDIIDEIAGETLYQYNGLISAFPISEKKYKQDIYNPFLINILREGIVLWTKMENQKNN